MIINTGNRTDIPAYYSDWFYNRIKEGFVYTRNPYYQSQVLKYQLNPNVIDILCFCSKNPQPMLSRLSLIKQYQQFWFITITPYGKDIEPNVPDKQAVMDSFIELSKNVGLRSISWRYDPIFINDKYTLEFHLQAFENMAHYLSGYVNNCVISFIDLYEKTKRNFPEVKEVTKDQQQIIAQEFVKIGNKYGIKIRTCLEDRGLKQYGVDVQGCMTKEILERTLSLQLVLPSNYQSKRAGCNCLLGNDIGMYNTCGHGCLYCYANYDKQTVVDNMKLHNPISPLLIGEVNPGDEIRNVKQVSFCSGQMILDL